MRQLKIRPTITNRDQLIEGYLRHISRIETISPDEEVELAQRIKAGDQDALNKLVCANLRFVVSVAKQYQHQGLPLLDLINEGNIGLIKAAKKFDETKGFKFISYAVWWIRQSILQALAEDSRDVRLPLNQVGLINRIRKTESIFEQENLRRPSLEELSNLMDTPVDRIEGALLASGKATSVDTPIADGEDKTIADAIPNDDTPSTDASLTQESLSHDVDRALSQLPEKEREILKLSFGLDGTKVMSLEEIGDQFGLTRERVRQIREKAIRKLKCENSMLLRSYL